MALSIGTSDFDIRSLRSISYRSKDVSRTRLSERRRHVDSLRKF